MWLSPRLLLLLLPQVPVLREITALMYNMSCNNETALDLAHKGLLSTVPPLLKSSDAPTQRFAHWTLANLAANPRTQAFFVDNRGAGIFMFIESCLAAEDEHVRAAGAWGFKQFMSYAAARASLLRSAAPDLFFRWISQMLRHRSSMVKLSAAWGLALAMATHPSGKKSVR